MLTSPKVDKLYIINCNFITHVYVVYKAFARIFILLQYVYKHYFTDRDTIKKIARFCILFLCFLFAYHLYKSTLPSLTH